MIGLQLKVKSKSIRLYSFRRASGSGICWDGGCPCILTSINNGTSVHNNLVLKSVQVVFSFCSHQIAITFASDVSIFYTISSPYMTVTFLEEVLDCDLSGNPWSQPKCQQRIQILLLSHYLNLHITMNQRSKGS